MCVCACKWLLKVVAVFVLDTSIYLIRNNVDCKVGKVAFKGVVRNGNDKPSLAIRP